MKKELELYFSLKGKPYRGRIENWYSMEWFESKAQVIVGYLYDKPVIRYTLDDRDGQSIRTSRVVELHENDTVVETMNSYYKLGTKRMD